ncbi:ATP-binding protein [Streptomyces sp. NPDC001219]
MSSSHGPDRTSQQITASGHARANQVGRDQYNYTTVWGPGSGPAPQALAALPATVDLVGRKERTRELLDVLDPSGPGPGMVVVTGLAGVGKTALALHTAHDAVARGWFPGGTLFVHLRGYDPAGPVSGDQALEALLRALGVREDDLPPTRGEQENLYRSELSLRARDGSVLIVADDASSAAQLRPLLPAHSGHRLLATSRDALVGPDVPARLIGLDQLNAQSAAGLIADALTRARPADSRPHQDPQAMREVAAHCGYLPLALTIAAAQLTADPGLPLTDLAADLADTRTRLEALRYQEHGGRSLAVQAAFDLSYRRLDDQHARLFRLLSLNPGLDLATDTAAALVGQPVRPARQSLAALARAGLISEQPVGSGRWRMHDLTRLYADNQCRRHDTDPARQQALSRLFDYYRDCTRAADHRLRALPGQRVSDHFLDRTAALGWLNAERLNLTATVALTAAAGHPDITTSLAGSLSPYLHQFRYFHDALATAQHALSAARELGDRHGEDRALNFRGLVLREVRRFEEAIDVHTQGLAICRELGDRHREATTRNNLGLALYEVRRFEEAIDAHTRAAAIFRELGDRHREATALGNLGRALNEVRRFEEAIDVHTQDLAICRELGDRHGEARALGNLGLALYEVRRFEEAIDAHSRAAAIYREFDDRHGEARALTNLGVVQDEVRRFEEAIDAHTRAAAIYREFDDRHSEAGALTNLGAALFEVRRFEEAIDAHSRAAAIFREFDDRHGEAAALGNLGLAQGKMRRSRGLRTLWRKLVRRS